MNELETKDYILKDASDNTKYLCLKWFPLLVVYVAYSLLTTFNTQEIVFTDVYAKGLRYNVKSFWGLSTQRYALSYRNNNWHIYHKKYTNDEWWRLEDASESYDY